MTTALERWNLLLAIWQVKRGMTLVILVMGYEGAFGGVRTLRVPRHVSSVCGNA
jgi:hypothetical protein